MVTGIVWGGRSPGVKTQPCCVPAPGPGSPNLLLPAQGLRTSQPQPDASRMKKPHRMMGFPVSPIHLQPSIWWVEGGRGSDPDPPNRPGELTT